MCGSFLNRKLLSLEKATVTVLYPSCSRSVKLDTYKVWLNFPFQAIFPYAFKLHVGLHCGTPSTFYYKVDFDSLLYEEDEENHTRCIAEIDSQVMFYIYKVNTAIKRCYKTYTACLN